MAKIIETEKKIELTEQQENEIKGEIKDLIFYMSHFESILSDIDQTNVNTYLGLFELRYKKICKILEYSSDIPENNDIYLNRIEKLKSENEELRKSSSNLPSAAKMEANIRYYEHFFRAFYEAMGFNYASIEYANSGLIAKFDCEIYEAPKPHISNLTDEFYAFRNNYENILQTEILLDKEPGIHRLSILDTDKNRELLQDFFSKHLPEASITGFNSRKDHNVWFLRWEMFVPFSSLDALRELLQKMID